MSAVPTNVGVFFGQVDKRAEGWYWADAQREKLKGAIRGPFETMELAVEDALQSFRQAPSDEPQERGAARSTWMRTPRTEGSLPFSPYPMPN
jgi:hypothetical protein